MSNKDDPWAEIHDKLAQDKKRKYESIKKKFKAKNLFNLALQLAQKGDLQKAIDYFKLVTEKKPKFYQAWANIGIIYAYYDLLGKDEGMDIAYYKRHYDRAIQCFNTALSIKPDFLPCLIGLADAYRGDKQYSKSMEVFNRVIKLNPESFYAFQGIGLIYFAKEKYNEATNYFKKSLSIEENNIDSLIGMGVSLYRQNEFDEALNFLSHALKVQMIQDVLTDSKLINRKIFTRKSETVLELIASIMADKHLLEWLESEDYRKLENKVLEFLRSHEKINIYNIAEHLFPAPLSYSDYLRSPKEMGPKGPKFIETEKIVNSAKAKIEVILINLIREGKVHGRIEENPKGIGSYFINEEKIAEVEGKENLEEKKNALLSLLNKNKGDEKEKSLEDIVLAFFLIHCDKDLEVRSVYLNENKGDAVIDDYVDLIEEPIKKINEQFGEGGFGIGIFDTEKYRFLIFETYLEKEENIDLSILKHFLIAVLPPSNEISNNFILTYFMSDKISRIDKDESQISLSPNLLKIILNNIFKCHIERKIDKIQRLRISKPKYAYKLILGGDEDVGKTSLLHRFVENSFDVDYKSTIGTSIMKKECDFKELSSRVRFVIWDLAGQSQFKRVRHSYLSNAEAGILVYDVTRQETFDCIKSYFEEISRAAPGISMILVGNKIDLERVVQRTEVEELAKILGVSFIETSAKTGKNIDELFKIIALQLILEDMVGEEFNKELEGLDTIPEKLLEAIKNLKREHDDEVEYNSEFKTLEEMLQKIDFRLVRNFKTSAELSKLFGERNRELTKIIRTYIHWKSRFSATETAKMLGLVKEVFNPYFEINPFNIDIPHFPQTFITYFRNELNSLERFGKDHPELKEIHDNLIKIDFNSMLEKYLKKLSQEMRELSYDIPVNEMFNFLLDFSNFLQVPIKSKENVSENEYLIHTRSLGTLHFKIIEKIENQKLIMEYDLGLQWGEKGILTIEFSEPKPGKVKLKIKNKISELFGTLKDNFNVIDVFGSYLKQYIDMSLGKIVARQVQAIVQEKSFDSLTLGNYKILEKKLTEMGANIDELKEKYFEVKVPVSLESLECSKCGAPINIKSKEETFIICEFCKTPFLMNWQE